MFPGKALELRILQLYIWTLNTKRFDRRLPDCDGRTLWYL